MTKRTKKRPVPPPENKQEKPPVNYLAEINVLAANVDQLVAWKDGYLEHADHIVHLVHELRQSLTQARDILATAAILQEKRSRVRRKRAPEPSLLAELEREKLRVLQDLESSESTREIFRPALEQMDAERDAALAEWQDAHRDGYLFRKKPRQL